jgi:hypothetical protein
MQPEDRRGVWFARVAVGVVFVWNLGAAFSFLARPERYAAGFELAGPAGRAVVQGIGVLFLMWNATYPPVILRPQQHTTLFLIVLIQQGLAVGGEARIWLQLPVGHAALRGTGARFLAFDGAGLLLMAVAFALLRRAQARRRSSPA